MIALLLLAVGLASPEPLPMREAVVRCDRTAMTELTRAEPGRRAQFALAAYDEQRAIVAERATLDGAAPNGASSAAGQASLDVARSGLEVRQRRLDDARAVERAWREASDELRAEFLASCTARRRDDGK